MSDVEVPVEAGTTNESPPEAPATDPDTSVSKSEHKSLRASTFGHELHHGDRDRWPSRIAFYMAAVGSAVGFGK